MRLLVEVSDSTLERIQSLLASGRYSSAQRFLQLAIENQLGVEETPDDVLEQQPAGIAGGGVKDRRQVEFPMDYWASLELPDHQSSVQGLEPHSKDDLGFRPGTGSWLWGQINNVFAIKFATRLVLRERLTEQEWPEAARIEELAREEGPVAGDLMRGLDQAGKRSRVHRWAKSFPTSDSGSAKRFAIQYFAWTQAGRIVGALPALGLARLEINDGGNSRFGLTELGIQLARLPNPVLDGDPAAATNKLSEDEMLLYIRSVVPASAQESEAFTTMAELLADGRLSGRGLWERLAEAYPEEWSEKEVLTYGNGAVSRMTDVGLVRRIEPGTSSAAFEGTDMIHEVL